MVLSSAPSSLLLTLQRSQEWEKEPLEQAVSQNH